MVRPDLQDAPVRDDDPLVVLPSAGFDLRLTYTNDWLFDIEVFRHGCCVAIDEALVRYRRHDDNLSTRARRRA